MLDCQQFYEALKTRGVSFFAGVPDSLLKDICAYITDRSTPAEHVITANEGSAVGLATGHYLATGELPIVYMQNSGLGNAVNPLTSLADPAVYGIPMLLLIGWRGEPGAKADEPQHVKMGEVTLPVLGAIDVPYAILPDEEGAAQAALDTAVAEARRRMAPYALIVRTGTFGSYKLPKKPPAYPMTREAAITRFLEFVQKDALIVSTTGKPSRELWEQRELRKEPHGADFLTVGSMGHSSQIALGVALRRPERQVYCLDGDGAVLMHLGGLCTIGTLAPGNYRHVVLNNGAHESVGAQPTVAFQVDLGGVARASGYKTVLRADDEAQLAECLAKLQTAEAPAFLEVRVSTGSRDDLARPKGSPRELRDAFMKAARGQ